MARTVRSWWTSYLGRLTQTRQQESRSRRRTSRQRPILEALEERWLLSAYTVTKTTDDGSFGTLRDAINQVNAGTYNEIDFNIAGTGVHTIKLTSVLPNITANGVSINGLSQGGASNTVPLIFLDGTNAGKTSNGLNLSGSNCTISGLILEYFNNNAIEVAGSNNVIGGTSAGAGNVIGSNGSDGILIDSGSSGVQVLGNRIGVTSSGGKSLGQGSNGIEVAGANVTIGGSTTAARNIISDNGLDGVLIDSSGSGVLVEGNLIGATPTNNAILGNGLDGVHVLGNNNTIGNTALGTANTVSANGNDGVELEGTGNIVQGNLIGTNTHGNSVLLNGLNGVEVNGDSNTIGGSTAAARNIISGNGLDGVMIDNAITGTAVEGNYIGTDRTGAIALANGFAGVEVAGSQNTIGGSNSAYRNVISGNSWAGVLIDSTGAGNVVQSNFLGTDRTGTKALGNSASGVEIDGSSNTIGGASGTLRNLISGNKNDGVLITGSSAQFNAVEGNFIGVNAKNNGAVPNGGYGVNIAASNNVIGGSTSAAGNVIADNPTGGVLVSTGSGDTLSHNSIFANGSTQTGPGIVVDSGANNNLPAPALSSATLNGSTLTVKGTFTAATAGVSYVLEFFADPTGDAEGKVYLGRKIVKPSSAGTVSFTFTTTDKVSLTDPIITATLTDSSGDTSPFSNGVTS